MNRSYSMLGLGKKAGYIISGETGCTQEIKRKKTKLIILADDASDNTKDRFEGLCKKHNIEYVYFGDKANLGKAIGKELTAVISIRDLKFSKVMLNSFDKA